MVGCFGISFRIFLIDLFVKWTNNTVMQITKGIFYHFKTFIPLIYKCL